MKKNLFGMTKILAVFAVAVIFMSFFAGCSSSTLLVGKWADRNGNTLEIINDEENGQIFNSEIAVGGISEQLTGTWGWAEGSDAINFFTTDGRVLLSMFEINGGILTITWATSANDSEILTMMRTK